MPSDTKSAINNNATAEKQNKKTMSIDFKLIGGIFLIVGTSIGAGMLALPIANAATGFPVSSLFIIICWAVMTLTGLLILEVNLWFPRGSNIISMARATLGKWGELVAWISYLGLLYTILCAYIAGGSDVFQNLLSLVGVNFPDWLSILLFVVVFGAIVYQGIKSVDYVNRGLMITKLSVYVILLFLVAPHTHATWLEGSKFRYALSSLMILITSFAFSVVIPSLRIYFEDDVVKLRKAIIIGSTIPLLAYLFWDGVIMGVIPRYGQEGLVGMLHATHTTTRLTEALTSELHNSWITNFFRTFASISMLTAFLAVSTSLSDFLSDGLSLKKRGKQGMVVFALTFIPSMVIVLFYPNAFIYALGYAGIFCVVLMIILPSFMAWSGRYVKKIASGYEVFGGKFLLLLLMVISILFLTIGLVQYEG